MKRIFLFLYLFVFLATCLVAAQHQHAAPKGVKQAPVAMYAGLGGIHHPISTKSAQAQKYFDQGLALLYGFNHDEAAKAFTQATKFDPELAMGYWGIALVNGMNYNAPEFPNALTVARENLKKAQELAPKASPAEQAYIAALTKRYGDDSPAPKREQAYSDAMKGVMESNIDDLDAATLYAETLMNLSPWQLWKDGKPGPNTEDVIAILESVLRRNPNHTGANHYYIHAVEASGHPERALKSADRLRDLKLSAGHLVHMPAHIYLRTGDYVQAADTNVVAADADRAYITRSGVKAGLYPLFYYSHNIHFQALADAMAGRYASAKRAADLLVKHVAPAIKDLPPVELFMPTPTYVAVRFQKWNDVLKEPEPDKAHLIHHASWQWGQGMAHVAKGDMKAAEANLAALEAEVAQAPAEKMVDKNSLKTVFGLAAHYLTACIAEAKKDYAGAEKHYMMAADIHDGFNYIEPPEWPFPVYEAIGNMKLAAGKADGAEAAFRDDLKRNPRNGRSLYGLMQSLKAQGKDASARLVEQEFKESWKKADMQLGGAMPAKKKPNRVASR
jgi:tetratricopeptide (TPR) repeat protein